MPEPTNLVDVQQIQANGTVLTPRPAAAARRCC
jgi:hypothetical protein